MKVDIFDFELPKESIANNPVMPLSFCLWSPTKISLLKHPTSELSFVC